MLSIKANRNIDFYAVLLGVGYIALPILIFLIGFLRFYVAIPLACAVIYCMYRTFANLYNPDCKIEVKGNRYIWIGLSVLVLFWIYFSGIGSFSFQNDDYMVRNPIFRDLINYKWPVIYDLSKMPGNITAITGTDKVMFVYYFAYWLPSAVIGKLFGETAANVGLYLWTLLGIALTIYFISRYLKKLSYHTVLVLMVFGGLDIIGTLLLKEGYHVRDHIEWWNFFQYSSNTTLLYWVFNQAVPTWLITALLLNCKNRKSVLFIASAIFCYSPFATFGMIPVAIYMYLKKYDGDGTVKQRILNGISFENCFMPIMMLAVFGLMYMSNSGSVGTKCWSFSALGDWSFAQKLGQYALGIILEFGLYMLVIRKYFRENKILWVALISLALIPFYKITPANDFAMRGSIPALFILTVFVIKYVQSNQKQTVIAIMLVISSVTAISEIDRSVYNTFKSDNYLKEEIYSFGDMRTDSDYWIHTCTRQFFARDYEDSAFYKYFAKQRKEQ